ncbi:MAG: extracellular solute-binding protein [Chloroflexota bacterium]
MITTHLSPWRKGTFVLTLLVLIAVLAACGATPAAEQPADPETAPESEAAPDASTEQEAAPEEAVAPTDAQDGTIQIAVVAGAMQDTMQTLADKFEAENPGMSVEIIQEPEGGAFEALIAAGNQPDIITGSFGYMPAKYASLDALIPLEDLEGAQELFARLDERTVQQDLGHNYYVPLGVDITMMIYNKELFEEAGLDPENPPQTFDAFLDAADQIQALPDREDGTTVYGTVFWNDALSWGGWYWNMLQPIYLNANQGECELLNQLGTDIVFDDAACTMEDFFAFTQAAQQSAPPTMEQDFFSRSIGMWPQYGYSWEPNLETAKETPMVIGEDVGIAPVPVPSEGDTSYTTLGGRPLMIMKTTPERQERAWQFVQFLMEDENNLQFIQELGYLPSITSLQSDPYFEDPARKPFVDALETAVYPQAMANFDSAANALLQVYQEAVVEGQMEPEAAVTAAAERAREELE